MKTKLLLLASLLLLSVPAKVKAQFTFVTNGNAITITGYTGTNDAVAIPSSTNGLPVTSIGDYAFYNANLTDVVIASGVTNLGVGAFEYCFNLTVITLPNSIGSIGNYAFFDCTNLTGFDFPTSVTLPKSLASIGIGAFEYCGALHTIIIPAGVTNLGTQAFQYCAGLRAVYFTGNAPSTDGTAFVADDATVYYLPGTTGWTSPFGGVPAVLWNPLIQTGDGGFGVQTNGFGFNITGTANIPIWVVATTGLSSLPVNASALLQSCTLTNGSIYFSDPAWTNSPQRFYRITAPLFPDPITPLTPQQISPNP